MKENETRIEKVSEETKLENTKLKFNFIPFRNLHVKGENVPRFKFADIRCKVLT